MLTRKTMLLGSTAMLAAAATGYCLPAAAAQGPQEALRDLERRSGGRLGVYAFELKGAHWLAFRAEERFPMCSTFKVLLAAAVLQRVDHGHERLAREIAYGPKDLEEYAPVTKAHVGQGRLPIDALCRAAVEKSDNTAANLLLRTLGGPEALTQFMRASLGDTVTRLDRTEPSLNTALPGDVRDTTTPRLMAKALAALVAGDRILTPASRQLLEHWMDACSTGAETLRAGLPNDWKVGDKTGTGERATRNDVAFIRRPKAAPIVLTAYLTGANKISAIERDATLARVAALVATTFLGLA